MDNLLFIEWQKKEKIASENRKFKLKIEKKKIYNTLIPKTTKI